jgi:hypothetical protein
MGCIIARLPPFSPIPTTVGGHKSKNWAVLHPNTGVAHLDFEGISS